MAVFSGQCGQSEDDGDEISGGTMDLTDAQVTITGGAHWGFFRIPGVTINRVDTVNSATLTVNIVNTTWDDPGGTVIYGHDIDNSPILTTTLSDISSRSRTSQSVTWNGTGVGSGDKTLDVTSIVAAIISRLGWVLGNAIGFIFDGTATSGILLRTWDNSTTLCARLVIDYTPVAGLPQKVVYYARMRA